MSFEDVVRARNDGDMTVITNEEGNGLLYESVIVKIKIHYEFWAC